MQIRINYQSIETADGKIIRLVMFGIWKGGLSEELARFELSVADFAEFVEAINARNITVNPYVARMPYGYRP